MSAITFSNNCMSLLRVLVSIVILREVSHDQIFTMCAKKLTFKKMIFVADIGV